MKFNFKAKNKSGDISAGVIDAVSREVAIELLQKKELFPLSITVENEDDSLQKIFLRYFDKVNTKELMIFFRQLAILIEARVPIVASLAAIKTQMDNLYFKKIIEEMINDVQDGLSLSDAMKKHKEEFSPLSINIVKAGEISGNLRRSVEYVANNIEKNYALTSKIKSAMTYPVIVVAVFLVIAFLVISFIIPKLTLMIKSMDGLVVPWYTTVVIAISDFMNQFWWEIALVIMAGVGGVIYYLKTADGADAWDRLKIKLPVFGAMYQYLYITRFAGNLAVLLAGGIPVIQALTIVSSVIGNVVYSEILQKAVEEIRIGGDMSSVLRRYPNQFPSIVSQMVKIGEESGQVDAVLLHIEKFYEQESNEMAKNLSTMLEPLLMVMLGISVAFLAFSVIMPIYNIAGQM